MNIEEARRGHISMSISTLERSRYSFSNGTEFVITIKHNNKPVISGALLNNMDMVINLIRSQLYSCGLMVMTKDWLTYAALSNKSEYLGVDYGDRR